MLGGPARECDRRTDRQTHAQTHARQVKIVLTLALLGWCQGLSSAIGNFILTNLLFEAYEYVQQFKRYNKI